MQNNGLRKNQNSQPPSALAGAITWNVLTWRLGIPSSSSHALVGGLVGAGVAKAGFGAVV